MSLELNEIAAGDHVEFLSDQQTEKGPSAGTVVTRNDHLVAISHSDHPGETFSLNNLLLQSKSTHHKGGALWIFY